MQTEEERLGLDNFLNLIKKNDSENVTNKDESEDGGEDFALTKKIMAIKQKHEKKKKNIKLVDAIKIKKKTRYRVSSKIKKNKRKQHT